MNNTQLTNDRSPLQILVFPYYRENSQIFYALFKRSQEKYWQGIAGGGEGKETPLEAAKREANEEANISYENQYIPLASLATMPVVNTSSGFKWGPDVLLLTERAFGVEITSKNFNLSHEHAEFGWFTFDEARKLLKWDSNRNALWELNHRLTHDVDITQTLNTLKVYS